MRASATGTEQNRTEVGRSGRSARNFASCTGSQLGILVPADADIDVNADANKENEDGNEVADEDVDCGAVYLKCLVESVLKYIKKFTAALARIEFMRIW